MVRPEKEAPFVARSGAGFFATALSHGVLLGGDGAAGGDTATGLGPEWNDMVRPVKELACALACRPCTSRSALQARWNKRVILVYSL
jgi:hypothetical protein